MRVSDSTLNIYILPPARIALPLTARVSKVTTEENAATHLKFPPQEAAHAYKLQVYALSFLHSGHQSAQYMVSE